jgi:hypothetical protein
MHALFDYVISQKTDRTNYMKTNPRFQQDNINSNIIHKRFWASLPPQDDQYRLKHVLGDS